MTIPYTFTPLAYPTAHYTYAFAINDSGLLSDREEHSSTNSTRNHGHEPGRRFVLQGLPPPRRGLPLGHRSRRPDGGPAL